MSNTFRDQLFEILIEMLNRSSGRDIIHGLKIIYIELYKEQDKFEKVANSLKDYLMQDIR